MLVPVEEALSICLGCPCVCMCLQTWVPERAGGPFQVAMQEKVCLDPREIYLGPALTPSFMWRLVREPGAYHPPICSARVKSRVGDAA